MHWFAWVWVGLSLALLIFVAIWGPNNVKGKRWRGHREPSAMWGPERRDESKERRY
ncbi:MAG: hypothetical protein ACRDJI_09440 [Actinomycetota bacterium]